MRWRPSVLVLGAALLAATACSGDDDEGGGAGEASERGSTTSTLVFTGDPASAFCTLLREVEVAGLLDEEAASTAEVEAGFTTVLDVLARVAEQAPEELREDTALVLAGVAALDDALRAVGYSYEALAADPDLAVEVSRSANDPAFAVANQRIEAYKGQVCGL
jgi:hypothetical protein